MNPIRSAVRSVAWVRDVHVVDETGSTNDDALRLASEGAPEGTVVFAHRQTSGRGRQGRAWWSPPGSALTASWIVRPAWPLERWTLLPIAAGVASRDAVAALGVGATLKWPNDVLVGVRKLAGILAEARPPDAVVVGLGVNISHVPPDDVAAEATSVAAEGGDAVEPQTLLAAVLERFAALIARPDTIVGAYRSNCATLGRPVRIERPNAEPLHGIARDVDGSGALILDTPDGEVTVTAGDAFHVRPV